MVIYFRGVLMLELEEIKEKLIEIKEKILSLGGSL